MTPRRTAALSASHLMAARPLLAALLLLAACGEKVVVCPPGHTAQGPYCYPDAPANNNRGLPDAGLPADICVGAACADAGPPVDSGPEPGWDVPDVGTPDIAKPDTAKVDTGPIKPTSPVGAACADDLDCKSGLSCFNWPKGYCTVLNCNAPGSPCPGSAVCWGQSEATHICNADCEQDKDCRLEDGYACKRLTAEFGGIDAAMCLPGGKNAVGQPCGAPLDCAGSATCLLGETGMAGGYCARVGCGKGDPCDPGTACVLKGKPTCLKLCTSDVDCAVPGKLIRKCVDRSDMGKQAVKVCLDSAKAAPVGSPCGADLDCDSKNCTVVAKGTCKGAPEKPCSTDTDCGALAPCETGAGKEQGVCTKPCATDAGCPLGSVCVPGPAELTGSCQANCKGPGDTETCAPIPGTECTFGQPIAPPGGVASLTYACAPYIKGGAGAKCSAPDQCDAKKCSTNLQGTAGFCLAACELGDAPCPFGTICVSSGVSQCQKVCSVDYDCPTQMVCVDSGKPGVKACQIP